MSRECETLKAILKELSQNAARVDDEEINKLAEEIKCSERIFIAGAGRSGFVARAFSGRLMHLGLWVFFVGEPTTPSIQSGDLLVVLSGSGETASLAVMAEKAKMAGARVGTVTIYPQARIGILADLIVTLPGGTPKSSFKDTVVSCQPMGNAFEQMSWLVLDALVIVLMKLLHKTEEDMFRLHANLE